MIRFLRRMMLFGLAVTGFLALVIGGLIANPVPPIRELPSIGDTVRAANREGMPSLSYFQARDGTALAYRHYPARQFQASSAAAILIHGSSGSSVAMHPLAKVLAERGIESFVPDIRGHGSSGTRGDIGYIGQLDDDLVDMVAHIRAGGTASPLILVGHSSGGGFALRVAGSVNQSLFTRTVLLAPYLGVKAPSTRPNAGWASPDVPRIVGLSVLRSAGIACCEQLPVIAFAVPENSARILTAEYSYRLLMNFGSSRDYRVDLDAAKGRITLIAGANDELMLSDKYQEAMQSKANVDIRVLDNANHMDVVSTGPILALVADDIARR